jgi:hypothetical protein
MNAADIKLALRRRYGSESGSGQWICVEEAFCGWSTSGGGVDLLALGVWQTAKASGLPQAGTRYPRFPEDAQWDATNPIVAHEVKVGRSDMRRELYGYEPGPAAKSHRTRAVPPWPHKAHFALARSHYFMFAVPKGLLKEEEIGRRQKPVDNKGLWLPEEAGLIEVDESGCHVRVEAPRRPAPPALSRHEVAELVRHVGDPARERSARAELARMASQRDHLIADLEAAEYELEGQADLRPAAA